MYFLNRAPDRGEPKLFERVQPSVSHFYGATLGHVSKIKIALGLLTPILLAYAIFRRLDNDEIEAIHTAWKVLHDGHIYQDFFQNHHPFLYYLLAPLIKLFGETTNIIYVARAIIFPMFLGIGYATYSIAKTLTNKTIGLLSALLLFSLPIFTVKAIEVRPDVPMMCFGMLAIALWYKYVLGKQSIWVFIASALLFGASFLFLQKAVFLAFFFGASVIPLWINKKINIKEITIYKIFFFLLPAIYLLYLLITKTFWSYLTFAWLFNMKMIGGCPPWHSLKFALLTNIPFWIMFGAGVFYAFKNKILLAQLFMATTLTLVFLFIPYSFSQYLMPALPFISIIAAYGLYMLSKINKKIFLPTLLLIVIPPIFTNYARRMILSPVSKQIEKIDYVLSISDKNDYVLDSEIGFDGFNLFRKDLDFFWLGVLFTVPTYNKIKKYKYDVYQLIKDKKPAAIGKLSITKIPAETIDPKKAYIIDKYYETTKKYPDLLIRKNKRGQR